MSENGTGLELLGFLGGTAKSKEAEAQKKLVLCAVCIDCQQRFLYNRNADRAMASRDFLSKRTAVLKRTAALRYFANS